MDYLQVINSNSVKNILVSEERLVLSCEVMEGTLAGKWTKRYLILTTQNLFNFTEDMQPKRIISIQKINNIVKKNGVDLDDCFDFLIEIDDEDD